MLWHAEATRRAGPLPQRPGHGDAGLRRHARALRLAHARATTTACTWNGAGQRGMGQGLGRGATRHRAQHSGGGARPADARLAAARQALRAAARPGRPACALRAVAADAAARCSSPRAAHRNQHILEFHATGRALFGHLGRCPRTRQERQRAQPWPCRYPQLFDAPHVAVRRHGLELQQGVHAGQRVQERRLREGRCPGVGARRARRPRRLLRAAACLVHARRLHGRAGSQPHLGSFPQHHDMGSLQRTGLRARPHSTVVHRRV